MSADRALQACDNLAECIWQSNLKGARAVPYVPDGPLKVLSYSNHIFDCL